MKRIGAGYEDCGNFMNDDMYSIDNNILDIEGTIEDIIEEWRR